MKVFTLKAALVISIALSTHVYADYDCKKSTSEESVEVFVDELELAKELSFSLCEAYGKDGITSDQTLRRRYLVFLATMQTKIKNQFDDIRASLAQSGSDELDKLYDEIETYLSSSKSNAQSTQLIDVVRFDYQPGMTPGADSQYAFVDWQTSNPTYHEINVDSNSCNPSNEASCDVLLSEIETVFSVVNEGYSKRKARTVEHHIHKLNEHWERYLDDARAQTSLDIWATTAWNADYLTQSQLVGPMEVQIFLVHPTIVYESVPDATDGNNDDLALAVEWFGFNYWDRKTTCLNKPFIWLGSLMGISMDCLQVPIGLGLTSIYSDKADVSDVGHGLSLYLGNHYSMGVVSRDGDPGYFISFDVYKLFQDKKSDWNDWQDKLKDL